MILRGENMIKTTSMLLEELSSYANPKAKLSRMVDAGDCVRISIIFSPLSIILLYLEVKIKHLALFNLFLYPF